MKGQWPGSSHYCFWGCICFISPLTLWHPCPAEQIKGFPQNHCGGFVDTQNTLISNPGSSYLWFLVFNLSTKLPTIHSFIHSITASILLRTWWRKLTATSSFSHLELNTSSHWILTHRHYPIMQEDMKAPLGCRPQATQLTGIRSLDSHPGLFTSKCQTPN